MESLNGVVGPIELGNIWLAPPGDRDFQFIQQLLKEYEHILLLDQDRVEDAERRQMAGLFQKCPAPAGSSPRDIVANMLSQAGGVDEAFLHDIYDSLHKLKRSRGPLPIPKDDEDEDGLSSADDESVDYIGDTSYRAVQDVLDECAFLDSLSLDEQELVRAGCLNDWADLLADPAHRIVSSSDDFAIAVENTTCKKRKRRGQPVSASVPRAAPAVPVCQRHPASWGIGCRSSSSSSSETAHPAWSRSSGGIMEHRGATHPSPVELLQCLDTVELRALQSKLRLQVVHLKDTSAAADVLRKRSQHRRHLEALVEGLLVHRKPSHLRRRIYARLPAQQMPAPEGISKADEWVCRGAVVDVLWQQQWRPAMVLASKADFSWPQFRKLKVKIVDSARCVVCWITADEDHVRSTDHLICSRLREVTDQCHEFEQRYTVRGHDRTLCNGSSSTDTVTSKPNKLAVPAGPVLPKARAAMPKNNAYRVGNGHVPHITTVVSISPAPVAVHVAVSPSSVTFPIHQVNQQLLDSCNRSCFPTNLRVGPDPRRNPYMQFGAWNGCGRREWLNNEAAALPSLSVIFTPASTATFRIGSGGLVRKN